MSWKTWLACLTYGLEFKLPWHHTPPASLHFSNDEKNVMSRCISVPRLRRSRYTPLKPEVFQSWKLWAGGVTSGCSYTWMPWSVFIHGFFSDNLTDSPWWLDCRAIQVVTSFHSFFFHSLLWLLFPTPNLWNKKLCASALLGGITTGRFVQLAPPTHL